MGKIIDVDFKKKRVNFTYEESLKDQQIEALKKAFAAIVMDVHIITKDREYASWLSNEFGKLIAYIANYK